MAFKKTCYPVTAELLKRIQEQSDFTVSNETSLLVIKLESIFKDALRAVIVYGSCLRNLDFEEGVIDLYVIVDNYRNAYRKWGSSLLNSILPPSVYYMELSHNGITLRAKYAVISMTDLRDGIENNYHSYLWSRFAQPVKVIYSDSESTKLSLYHLFGISVMAYLSKTIPALGSGRFSSDQIWTNALTLSYAAELRPERQNRAQFITEQSKSDFHALTLAASPALSGVQESQSGDDFNIRADDKKQRKCLWNWRLRRMQGRILSLIRFIKAAFTFNDAVNYAAWKIKRHTGITIEVTPVLQRHPILFGFNVLWRLLRRGVLH